LLNLQEIEPRCAEALCRLFEPDENIELRSIALKAKRARRSAQLERERYYREPPQGGHRAQPPPQSSGPPPPRYMDSPRLGLLKAHPPCCLMDWGVDPT